MFSVQRKNIIHLFEIGRFSGDEKTNNQTKETQDRAEDLNHEDLDKPGSSVSGSRWKDVKGGKRGSMNSQAGIGRIGQSGTTTVNTHGYTTDQVAHADGDAGPEEGVSGVIVTARIHGLAIDHAKLG